MHGNFIEFKRQLGIWKGRAGWIFKKRVLRKKEVPRGQKAGNLHRFLSKMLPSVMIGRNTT